MTRRITRKAQVEMKAENEGVMRMRGCATRDLDRSLLASCLLHRSVNNATYSRQTFHCLSRWLHVLDLS